MNKLLILIIFISMIFSADVSEDKEKYVGRYQVATTTYTSPKTGKLYIVGTVIDTKTGEIIKRKRFYYTKYKKDMRNKK